MKLQRCLVVLTAANLVLLMFVLAQLRPAAAQDQVVPVLRGRGLEIVDQNGRIRASITVTPGSTTFPEVVVFRLHDRIGKPTVKLDTHEAGVGHPKGSGLGLLGDTDDTQAFIGTESSMSKVDLKNKDGQRRRLQP